MIWEQLGQAIGDVIFGINLQDFKFLVDENLMDVFLFFPKKCQY
jgi:hypothetical protein